jgi:hypothetical protein
MPLDSVFTLSFRPTLVRRSSSLAGPFGREVRVQAAHQRDQLDTRAQRGRMATSGM